MQRNPNQEDHEDDDLQDPEQVPSFLTARELQAREPGKAPANEDDAEEAEESPAIDKPRPSPRRRPGANSNS